MQVPLGQVHGDQAVTPAIMMVAPQAHNQTNNRAHCCSTKKAQIVLGSFQIILGILAIVFNIVAIIVGAELSPVSHGIWSGIIFVLAGSFQVVAGKTGTRCWIITSMVFAIIAAVFCIPVLILSAIGIPLDKDNEKYTYYDYYYPYWNNSADYDARYAMNGIIVTSAILEAIVAIVASTMGCKTLCCAGISETAPMPHQVHHVANPSQPGQPMMILTPLPGNHPFYQNQSNGQPPNSTQPGLLPTDQTMQPTHQVLAVPALAGTMQNGFTAPVLTASGAPPAYSYIQPAPTAASAPLTQNQPASEPEK